MRNINSKQQINDTSRLLLVKEKPKSWFSFVRMKAARKTLIIINSSIKTNLCFPSPYSTTTE